MTTLITGATGRVGRELVRSRQAMGESIRALVLPDDPGRADLEKAGVEIIVGSLTDKDAVAKAVADMDIIVHLAAVMLWEPGADQELFSQNIGGAFNLFDAVVSQGLKLKRFFIASSDEVYPSLKALYTPIDERHPQNPYSFYGLTKEVDERLAFFYHRAHGIPVTVARFALIARSEEITRPDGWSGRFLFVEPMRGLFNALGRPDAVAALDAADAGPGDTLLLALDPDGVPYEFHIVDVIDLIEGINLMLANPSAVAEVFNLSGPSPFSYRVAVETLHKALDLPFVEVRIPGPAIRISHEIAKAKSILGYKPVYDIQRIIAEATKT
ncbi:MAG: NAD(P)-dependent oxidoreductase [Hyphomicrobiales bacterium]|nr:NAD(P)-dependent oxidoreductase [Hyphomicrobiales bacterium]